MAIQSISDIIQTAKGRQYLLLESNSFQNNIENGRLSARNPYLIYTIRKSLERMNTLNPNDPNLRSIANYLWYLVSPLIVSNTNLATINLSAVAVSTTEIDLVWTTVPNATQYILEHALDANFLTGLTTIYAGSALSAQDLALTPSTHYYYRVHATASGYTNSPFGYADATTQAIPVTIPFFAWFGSSDPYPALSGGTDSLTYQITGTIPSHNAAITVPWTSGAANNQYEVVKYPETENIKTIWSNTLLNSGVIPDAVFRAIFTFGGFNYIVSRNAMSLDSTQFNETFS